MSSPSQRVKTRSIMRRLSRAAPPGSIMKPPSRIASIASLKAGRQARLIEKRPQAGIAGIVQEIRNALDWHLGQLDQRLFEESDIAGKKRPQNKTGGELPARAQVADERAHLRRRRFRRERHRRLFAGLAGDALRVIGIEPSTRGDKIDQRRGNAGDHFETGRRREIVPSQQRFANGGPFAKTLENAIDRELGNLSIAILCKYQTSLGRADF